MSETDTDVAAPERPGSELAVESEAAPAGASAAGRHRVLKTYKLYVGGKFPRTESGRYDRLLDGEGNNLANVCRASRKDFRDAVVAARAAQPGWAGTSAYNRGQVLYRVAEMLEGRSAQLVAELEIEGAAPAAAETEVAAAVDLLIGYAGWCDKVQQVFSTVNPVASSHFNFSMLEPTGVVAALAPASQGLLGLVSTVAPIVVPGNACVALAAPSHPLSAITFAEVLHSSDVPGGVVNLLTGRRDELLLHFASHLDVNALVVGGSDATERELAQREAVHNVKRVVFPPVVEAIGEAHADPYRVLDTCEVKTTWHPIGS
jgi:acyl-CoA reductase-like NAD-dependent aldehyde dehydrogenase